MDTLQTLVPQATPASPDAAPWQPPLLDGDTHTRPRLHAIIASLALGGAERIVLDWAARSARRFAVRLAVLRDAGRHLGPVAAFELLGAGACKTERDEKQAGDHAPH